MTSQDLTRIFITQQDEFGPRVYSAIARENVSGWNAEWEIDGRFLDAAQRQCDEFREIVSGLRDLVAS